MNDRYRIMFVCMGNICRSPLAHGIMNCLLEEEGLDDKVVIESSGTISYHTGELPDTRMREEAKKHGVSLKHRAQQFTRDDYHNYDLILAMDKSNLVHIKEIAGKKLMNGNHVKLFRSFDPEGGKEVPDPYYGGPEGFSNVYSIVERSCRNLLEHVKKECL